VTVFQIYPGRNTEQGRLLHAREDTESLTFTVKQRHLGYFNSAMRSKCFVDMLAWGLFPNAKEVTESWGAYNAAVKLLGRERLSDPTVCVLVVGDGSTPRTGATFAMRSKWNVSSIDPQMKECMSWENRVERLICYSDTAESYRGLGGLSAPDSDVIVVGVHSHASIQASLDAVTDYKSRHLIWMPCCKKDAFPREPDMAYDDYGIWSEERAMMIWRNV